LKIEQKKGLSTKKAAWLQTSTLSWLLLGVWLAYSATMLWKLKAIAIGTQSMCITRR